MHVGLWRYAFTIVIKTSSPPFYRRTYWYAHEDVILKLIVNTCVPVLL